MAKQELSKKKEGRGDMDDLGVVQDVINAAKIQVRNRTAAAVEMSRNRSFWRYEYREIESKRLVVQTSPFLSGRRSFLGRFGSVFCRYAEHHCQSICWIHLRVISKDGRQLQIPQPKISNKEVVVRCGCPENTNPRPLSRPLLRTTGSSRRRTTD